MIDTPITKMNNPNINIFNLIFLNESLQKSRVNINVTNTAKFNII